MEKNYEIVLEFVKDISSETKNAETFVYVKENLKRYNLNIDINSLALKNQLIEVNTKLGKARINLVDSARLVAIREIALFISQ